MPGIWSDLAQWVGPTPNQSGPMVEQRGMILHIMQGSLAGSIAWGKNPASSVSFHFGTRKSDGLIQQLVNTDVTAWTQGAGNGHWVSVENEDYSGIPLSAAQLESVSQLYARGVREYGWPYQLADAPSGRGLGWHGMGGAAWGGHYDCPGQPVVDQRPAILTRAYQINNPTPTPPPPGGDDMAGIIVIDENPNGGQFLLYPAEGGMAYSNIGDGRGEVHEAWVKAGWGGPLVIKKGQIGITAMGKPAAVLAAEVAKINADALKAAGVGTGS